MTKVVASCAVLFCASLFCALAWAAPPANAAGKKTAPTAKGDAAAKPGDASAKPGDASAKPGDAAAKPGDATAKPGDAAAKPAAEAHARPTVEADPAVLHLGDDAPMFNGVLHNPREAGINSIDLSSLVGSEADDNGTKAVLISFFATFCAPCKKEMPLLQELSAQYKEKGLRVISVAVDRDEAAWPQIAELVAKHSVTFPVVKDRYNLIARRYLGERTALPSVFIIARDGTVQLVKQGYPNDAKEFLRAEVEKALAPPAAADGAK